MKRSELNEVVMWSWYCDNCGSEHYVEIEPEYLTSVYCSECDTEFYLEDDNGQTA